MNGLQKERRPAWEKLIEDITSSIGARFEPSFPELRTFLLFVGYPRSGHTLIGSLLDAHPNILLAHEQDVLYYAKRAYSARQISYLLKKSNRAFTKGGRKWMGYNYAVSGQWQGRYEQLLVLGDKSGGRTSRRLLQEDSLDVLYRLEKRINAPIVFLHIIRNPFDIVTTMMKRTTNRRNLEVSEKEINKKIRHFLQHAEAVDQLKNHSPYKIIDVYFEEFVENVPLQLSQILEHIGMKSNEAYLKACNDLVWKKPKTTRNETDLWHAKRIEDFSRKLKAFDWFERYSFDN
ncbi:MAG: sulfotransferase [Bacteroidota bacterium]